MHARGEGGVTLVELLVAVTLFSLALATIAVLATAVMAGFEADPAAADQQQRVRSGINALIDDVQRAGSGFVQAPDDGPGSGLPSLLPAAVSSGPWVVRAVPHALTTVQGRRGAAHATLRALAATGDVWLRLSRPAYCPAASVSCGFAAGDDVLIFDAHGRFAIAAIRQVVLPLELELTGPLAESWRAGASVSSIVAHAYGLRPDPVTGLGQLVRSLAAGPASPVIDFVTRFDIDWHAASPAPMVRVAPDGTQEDATAGPRPPMPGAVSETGWPAGENCAYTRNAADAPAWRAGAVPESLAAFNDGPWCPSAGAPSRWDVDLARVARVTVTLGVAVASARLRLPMSVLHGVAGGSRVVPDLIVVTDLIPGRRNGGQ